MSRRSWVVLLLFLVAVSITGYVSFLAGANRALATSTSVSALFIKGEDKCFQSGDVECFRASWFLRAGATAQSARRLLDGSLSSSVDPELRSYLQWTEQLPKVYTPAK